MHLGIYCPNGCHPRFLAYQRWADEHTNIVFARHQGRGTTYWFVLRCCECGEPEIYCANVAEATKRVLDRHLAETFGEMVAMDNDLAREKAKSMDEFYRILMEETTQ